MGVQQGKKYRNANKRAQKIERCDKVVGKSRRRTGNFLFYSTFYLLSAIVFGEIPQIGFFKKNTYNIKYQVSIIIKN